MRIFAYWVVAYFLGHPVYVSKIERKPKTHVSAVKGLRSQ